MLKVFGFGVFLGLALAAAAAWFVPVNDLHREASLISVQPNGGNTEIWRIHVPEDRMVAGTADSTALAPAALAWPPALAADGIELEVFKVRNRNDIVIGVASRLAVSGPATAPVVEWMLHLPARGSMYFPLGEGPDADGVRRGRLRGGTQEFAQRGGEIRERYLGSGSGGGTIELQAVLISTQPRAVPGGLP